MQLVPTKVNRVPHDGGASLAKNIMNTYDYQGQPATDAQITSLETRLGHAIPPDYRDFLKSINGGQPHQDIFRIRWSGQSWAKFYEQGSVSVLFGLRDDEGLNLEEEWEDVLDRIPPGTLPIGNDPGGSLLVLRVVGPNSGEVWFWVQEYEVNFEGGETPDYRNMGHIATSFQQFLDLLEKQ